MCAMTPVEFERTESYACAGKRTNVYLNLWAVSRNPWWFCNHPCSMTILPGLEGSASSKPDDDDEDEGAHRVVVLGPPLVRKVGPFSFTNRDCEPRITREKNGGSVIRALQEKEGEKCNLNSIFRASLLTRCFISWR